MAFPPAHLLVGAGIGELLRGGGGGAGPGVPPEPPLARWRAWAVGAGFAVLPDLHTLVLFAMGAKAPEHGLFTHSVLAVALVGVLVWSLFGARWGVLAIMAYASHLIVDLLREGNTSVRLAWPLVSEPAQGIFPLFPTVPFEAGGGLRGEAPSFYGSDPLGRIFEQTAIGAAFFVAALVIAALLRRSQRARRRAGLRPPGSPRPTLRERR